MTEVISVKFKNRGKAYYFAPNGLSVPDGAQVVVETAKGLELADCVKGNHPVADESIIPPLRPAVRLATPDDLRIAALCREREREAFRICEEKIARRGLDMKLVDVECSFEGSKILFFFTSDGRVDFRELVKDLAGVFRTRIELRQIGVRDEAKMIGGLGICGRAFCCSQFLDEFQPVSTKMAKVQSLSLNPAKISGSCGRLMCCLRYEQEAYEELVKSVPKNGAFVETPAGYGSVTQVNLLRQKVKVRLDGGDESLRTYDADEVAAVPGGRPRPGEPLPHVLKLKARPPKPVEPEENEWQLPELFGESMYLSPEPDETPAPESGERKQQRRSRRKKSGGAPKQSAPPKQQNAEPPRPAAKKPSEPDKPAPGGKPGARRGGGKKPAEPAAQPAGKNPQRGGSAPGSGKSAAGGNLGSGKSGGTAGNPGSGKSLKPRGNQPAAKPNTPKPAAEGEKKKRSNRRYYGRGPKPGAE